MEDHLREILGYVVEQAVANAEPVGSQFLVNEYKLSVSPATVRNYFTTLEQDGYIMQPHTSSGRLPTEKGYEYYIDHLLKPRLLSKKESSDLTAANQTLDSDRQIKMLAKSVAELAQNTVLVGIGDADCYYTGLSNLFGQPEFKDWNRVVSMSDILDRLDEVLFSLRQKQFDAPTTMVGNKCPFGPMCGSVLISLPGGYLFGILGPMRMDYGLSISLLNSINQLLKSSYEEKN